MDKKPSGAQYRKRRKEEADTNAARERERTGMDTEWAAEIARLGAPPLDPIGNSEWSNNVAALMAHAILRDPVMPLEDKFKRTAEMLDRINASTPKAVISSRIKRVEEKAGLRKEQRPDGTQLRVDGRAPLRAGRVVSRREAADPGVPGVCEQGNGGAPVAGGRDVGPDGEGVH